MKKFIISEEEKNRILGMHQDATKRHYLKEQEVPQPAGNVNKRAEINTQSFKNDVNGKILAQNPQFVKLINDNNINLPALLQQITMEPNKRQFSFKGSDGKDIAVSFSSYGGTNYQGAIEKYNNAFTQIKKVYDQIKANPNTQKCVNPNAVMLSDTGEKGVDCRSVKDNFNNIKKTSGVDVYSNLSELEKFVQAAPKFKTA